MRNLWTIVTERCRSVSRDSVPASDPARDDPTAADTLRDAGRWAEAAAAYERALLAAPASPALHVQHGHALKEAGLPHRALAAYDRALALAPDDADTMLHRAHLLKRMGDPGVLPAFRRLAELAGDGEAMAEIARLAPLFEPPSSAVPGPAGQPAAMETRPVSPVPLGEPAPGLHPRRRAVRFVAGISPSSPPPVLKLTVDGKQLWSGEVAPRTAGGRPRVDSVFSFPEPQEPTDTRSVTIEAESQGVDPARATLTMPYAERFDGDFVLDDPDGRGLVRTGTARFVDREGLTITPAIRGETEDGQPVSLAVTGWKREGDGFELGFTTSCREEFRIYPMWSTRELKQRARPGSQDAPEREPLPAAVGRVLAVAGGRVEGWALHPGRLDAVVAVEVLADDILVGRVRADLPRRDLAEVTGDGAHGFRIALPAGVRDGTVLTLRARGAETGFASFTVLSASSGVMVAAARPASEAAQPAATGPGAVGIAALLLCRGDVGWRDSARRKLARAGIAIHEIVPKDTRLTADIEAAMADIAEDYVLVLGEAADWDGAALDPMKHALDSSGAAIAVPTFATRIAGTPDRWGWALDMSGQEPLLRPSPPSPWLISSARASGAMPVAGGDWTVASLIARRRWHGGAALSGPAAAVPIGLENAVLATEARIQARVALPEAAVAVPAAAARGFQRALRSRPLAGSVLSGRPPVIALLTTSTRPDALEGDVIVARELAAALAAVLPQAELRLIAREPDGGADLFGIDTVICLRDDCDPRRFRHLSSGCRVIFWVRNCFDAFLDSGNWRRADDVWMSSERETARFLRHTGLPARLLRIATNAELFGGARPDPLLACDICFTGSYWGIHREIAVSLAPEILDATVRIFGEGWEAVPELAAVAQGPAPYSAMPAIYASARLVIDDANHVTVDSGSVNSRVYDAIVAGALPITNGVLGARETFGDLLPVYRDAQSLTSEIRRWLGDEPARKARVAMLRAIVEADHNFTHRARAVAGFLGQPPQPSVAVTGHGPAEAGGSVIPDALRPVLAALADRGYRADWIADSDWSGPAIDRADIRLHVGSVPAPAARAAQPSIAWFLSELDALSPRMIGGEVALRVSKAEPGPIAAYGRNVGRLDWPDADADLAEKVETLLECLR